MTCFSCTTDILRMCKFALRKIGGKLLFYSYQRRTEDQRWVGETSLPTFLVFLKGDRSWRKMIRDVVKCFMRVFLKVMTIRNFLLPYKDSSFIVVDSLRWFFLPSVRLSICPSVFLCLFVGPSARPSIGRATKVWKHVWGMCVRRGLGLE